MILNLTVAEVRFPNRLSFRLKKLRPLGMTMTPPTNSKSVREDIVRQLEQFPVEVLEAALLVLQAREAKAATQNPA